MKYIFSFIVVFLMTYSSTFALSKEDIIPTTSGQIISSTAEGTSLLDYMLAYARDTIFALLALIAIGMFLYIGGRLVVARGNPEEFSKALKSFVYAGVGIFVVVFAWAAVRFIAGINL